MDYLSGWCKSKRRLDDHTVIVTGCNTGIGKETVEDLFVRGARVIMACRDVTKAEIAKNNIEQKRKSERGNGELIIEELDLSKLNSVSEFVFRVLKKEPKIHILINNAGVMMCPEEKTDDGFECHMGTNHFGPALLTLMLLPRIRDSAPSRIIFLSSYVHKDGGSVVDDINFEKKPYRPLEAYAKSKAANVLFAKALAQKLIEHKIKDVTTYSVHPGVINTEISRHFSETAWYGATWMFNNILGWFLKSPRCGAQTSIYCAVDEACSGESGLYYCECAPKPPAKFCQDDATASELWNVTIGLLNLKNYDPFGRQDPIKSSE